MRSLIQYFSEPFPYFHRRWLVVVVSMAWIFLLGIILKPLGLHQIKNNQFEIILLFMLVAAISVSAVLYILPLFFKKYFNPETWSKGRYWCSIIVIILIAAPISTIVTYYICKWESIPITISPVHQLLIWCMRASMGALLPSAIFYFIYRNEQMQETLNREIKRIEFLESEGIEELVNLTGSTKESLLILPQNILYAEVSGNYVAIHYLNESNENEKKLLRTTLQQIIDVLSSYSQFVRCHRSIIVNVSNITNIRGNSHAYYLTLRNLGSEVPVSKTYTKAIKEKLNL